MWGGGGGGVVLYVIDDTEESISIVGSLWGSMGRMILRKKSENGCDPFWNGLC